MWAPTPRFAAVAVPEKTAMRFRLFAAALAVAAFPVSAQFCPVGNNFGECGFDESILTVTVGAFTHTSPCLETDYEDLTALPPIPIVANVPVAVSVTIANFFASDRVTLWIDLDDDQTFGAGEDFDLPDPTAAGIGDADRRRQRNAPRVGRLLPAADAPHARRDELLALPDPQPPCGTSTATDTGRTSV
jgi:hypothetical protein